jgi:RNA polymerase sigma-70 factor (ECF subfamily)
VSDAHARLGALMSAHGHSIHAYCARMTGDRALADDLLQHVFLQAFRDLDTLRDVAQARAWLFGVAHHRCLDALKARRRAALHFQESPELPEGESRSPTPPEDIDQRRRERALEACLGELSAEVRAAVILRFHDQMTYEAMAEIVGDKPATLQARVARAMPVLRRCLESKGMEP